MSEEWRDIPGFPGYKASDMGRIASCKKFISGSVRWIITSEIQRILAGAVDQGYRFYSLSCGKCQTVMRAYRLVMLAFVGPCPDGLEVCHNNGKKHDCRLSNLRYDTRAANVMDAFRHGAWMAERDVISIREQYADGQPVADIADVFEISGGHVCSIARGAVYKTYGGPVTHRHDSISVDDIACMIRLRESGMFLREIAARFSVSKSYICHILHGRKLVDKFEQAQRSIANG